MDEEEEGHVVETKRMEHLAVVERELAELSLGEAEQRAAGSRRGGSGGGGGASAEGAGERGCADVRRRGGHFLWLRVGVGLPPQQAAAAVW